jgi:predicted ABC-type ATPase
MDNIPTDHPTLMLIRGIPGSGKSYLATALESALGKDNILILDPDAIDLTGQAYLDFSAALTKDGVDEKFHPYRWSRAKAYAAIEAHKIVIWNQGFTNLDGFTKTVVNLQTYATDHGTELPLLVVEVEAPHDVVKQRVAERAAAGGHNVTDEAFERFFSDYRSFSDEGFTTVTVDGQADVTESVAAVVKGLEALWKQ